ncbi:MAG: EamA family transporter [Planctomycetia bacterium]|nr:EamA family transporter [Planctomycetia bacterium]
MEQEKVEKHFMSDTAYGTLLCVLSDTLFSVAYVFVQFINKYAAFAADWKGDWILCFKEWIAAAFALPIFLYLWSKGRAGLPSFKVILMLFIAAFFCEYIGIGHHVTSYQFIGMALGLPVIRTVTILGATIVGALLLREKVSPLKAATIAVLVAAVFMFGFCRAPQPTKPTPQEAPAAVETVADDVQVQPALVAENVAEKVAAEKAPDTVATEVLETKQAVEDSVKTAEATAPTPKYFGYDLKIDPFLFGFICAFITGIGYAIYTLMLRVVMRKEDPVTKKPVPPVNIYFVVSTVFGFGGLCGLLAMLSKGAQLSDVAAIPVACWLFILGAGVLTFAAFFFKNLSYRYATASKAATLSVVQVLLQVLFGVIIFGEATTALFWGGAVLTVTGIILASKTA